MAANPASGRHVYIYEPCRLPSHFTGQRLGHSSQAINNLQFGEVPQHYVIQNPFDVLTTEVAQHSRMASRVWCDQRLRTAVASLSRLRVCSLKTRTSNEDNFEELLRKSSFVRLGRPRGKSVQGKVTHVVAAGEERDDLYVDFGWKFHAVVNQKRRRYASLFSPFDSSDTVAHLANLTSKQGMNGKECTLSRKNAPLPK